MQKSRNSLIDFSINIKIKLAALWTSLMFLYIYADYFELKTPDTLENMVALKTPIGPTTPVLLVIFSVILIVPTSMIFLSVFLKPLLNKWLNIVVGILYALISLLIIIKSIDSEWQMFFVLYNIIEIVVLCLIVKLAIEWPQKEIIK